MVVTERTGFLISIVISILVSSVLLAGQTGGFFWPTLVGVTVALLPIFWVGVNMNLDVSRVARRSWRIDFLLGALTTHGLAAILVGRLAMFMASAAYNAPRLFIDIEWAENSASFWSTVMIFPAIGLVKIIKFYERGAGRGTFARIPLVFLFGCGIFFTTLGR